jgi:ATP-dependent protease ClpP protease subunit
MPERRTTVNYNRIQGVIAREKARFIAQIRVQNKALADELENLSIPWWSVRNADDSSDTTEVAVYEAIGGWWGMAASDFIADISKITTANIRVRINSPGGSVFDSIAIFNALVMHPANVITQVDSLAASGASIIAMAGDSIVMGVGSQMMIHDASGIELGNAAMMREMADFLDKQSDNIADIYAEKSRGETTAEEFRALMLAETWMTAKEAVESGLADEVYTKPAKTEEKPPGKDPEKPVEPSKEGEEGEESGDGNSTDPEEDDVEDLLHRMHSLGAFNYKHPGRKYAPAPKLTNSLADEIDIDAFCDALARN